MNLLIDQNPTSPTYGDLVLTNGNLTLVSGTQEILQSIFSTLRTFLGEWFLDNTIGVDYFGQILTKNPDQGLIDSILLAAIQDVPGVQSVTQFSSSVDFVNRVLSVSFQAQTTQGTVNYNGTV